MATSKEIVVGLQWVDLITGPCQTFHLWNRVLMYAIASSFLKFLEETDSLDSFQSSFRLVLGAETALVDDLWRDRGSESLLDVSEAFNSIDHGVLSFWSADRIWDLADQCYAGSAPS